jgi:acyl carrier protein
VQLGRRPFPLPRRVVNVHDVPTRNEEEVRAQIREIVQELAPNPQLGTAEHALLVEDLEYHSLALLELAFALEDEFDLPPIDEENARSIRSAQDIEDYVLRQLEDKSVETPAG